VKASKAELERVARKLARALRMQPQYTSLPDENNCWCAGE